MQIRSLLPTLVHLLLVLSASQVMAGEQPSQSKTKASPAAKPVPIAPMERTKGKLKPVGLNSATKNELQFMLKIDEALATKIIAGRPYRSKADLVSRGVMSMETYQALKAKVIVK